MTALNKQALREAANAANIASWGKWESYKPHKGARGYEVKVGAKAVAQHCLKVDSAFIAAANPPTVLALLDELEAAEKRIAEPVSVPDEVMAAMQKVARIRLDMNDFDGDKRGILDCLGDAEDELIEVVNLRSAILQAGNSPVIPDGWVAVPERPTQEMMDAFMTEVNNHQGYCAGYLAMLAAAPQQEVK